MPDRPSKLDLYAEKLSGWLRREAGRPRKQRRAAKQLYGDLVSVGYDGSYNRVAAFARAWKEECRRLQQTAGRGSFVPLPFAPGEAFQFDWSQDFAIIRGVRVKLQVAHLKLYYSRAFIIRAYLLQTHEMLLDAHNHAFRAFGGGPRRGIYDNRRTAVDKVGRGKERSVNVQASGWEKGQVEKNVQDARHCLWRAMPSFESLDALNGWLEQRCQELWRQTRHGTEPGMIADVWAQDVSPATGF